MKKEKSVSRSAEAPSSTFLAKKIHVRRRKGMANNLETLVEWKMMVDKVVDNNKSKTLSKVKMHDEFIYAIHSGYNWPEHSDSAVDLQIHAN